MTIRYQPKGLFSNAGPHDVPSGFMRQQDNWTIIRNGEWRVRKGIQPIGFSGYTPSGSSDVIAMTKFARPETTWIVYERADGSVKAICDGQQKTIATGFNPFWPLCFYRDRRGVLFMVNGIDKPQRWNGVDAATSDAGIPAPPGTPAVQTTLSGNAGEGNYYCAYRFVDADGFASVLSELTTVPAVAGNGFSYYVQGTTNSRVATIEIYRSTQDQTTTLYLVASIAAASGTVTFTADAFSDEDLLSQTALPILNPNNLLNARRQVPPPSDKPFAAILQDRVFFYGLIPYTMGTVAVSNGSPNVTGTGTAWPTTFIGRSFCVTGTDKQYPIADCTATTLKLGKYVAPLAYWKLDEGAGKVTFDAGSAGLNLFLTGTSAWSATVPAPISFTDPFSFNANGSSYFTGSPTGLPTAGSPRSVTGWFKPTSAALNSSGLFFYQLDAASGIAMELRILSSKLFLVVGGTPLYGATTLSAGTMYFVSATFDGTTITLDLNAVSEGTTTPPSSPTLSGTLTHAAVAGVATFTGLSLNLSGTGYQIKATASGYTAATTSAFNVSPIAATKLATTTPSNTVQNLPFGVTVTAQDAFSNTDPTFTGPVTLAITTNPGSGTLAGTKTVNAVAGVATFTGLSINAVGTGYVLTATSGSLTSAVGGTFNITAGTTTKLIIPSVYQPPATVIPNTPFDLVVYGETVGSALDTTFSGNVTIALSAGSGTLSGTLTVQAHAGVATFAGLSITAGTGFAITATSGGLTSATTSSFDSVGGTAVSLKVTGPAVDTKVATSFSLTVAAVDVGGNTDPSNTASVTIALASDPPGGSTFGGTLTASLVSGVHVFTGLTLDKLGSGFVIRATATGLDAADSHDFNVTATTGTIFVITTNPTATMTAGDPFDFVVTLQDGSSVVDVSFFGTVTVALGTNSSGSTLSGTASVAAAYGVAAFRGLSINKVGATHTLIASTPSVTSVTSSNFATTAATINGSLSISTQPPPNNIVGGSFGLVVTALDPNGNTVSGFTGNVTLSLVGQVASGPPPAASTLDNTLYLGRGSQDGLAFTGLLDDWRVYDVALSAAEKSQIYAGDLRAFVPSNYSGSDATGQAYVIQPPPERERALDWSEPDEPESVPLQDDSPLQENVVDHDLPSGLLQHSAWLWIMHDRHAYKMSFVQQPDADMNINPPLARGLMNNRCGVVAEDTAYCLDQLGIYRLSGQGLDERFALRVQDYFRDSIVDWTQTKWWSTEYEPNEKTVRFYVAFAADSATRPMRAICYNTITDAFWTESYPWQIGAAARTVVSGQPRLALGGQTDHVYLANQGVSDGIATAIVGNVTSATAATLSDSNATFTSGVIGVPVIITGGKGFTSPPQTRIVSAITGAPQTRTPTGPAIDFDEGVAPWTNLAGVEPGGTGATSTLTNPGIHDSNALLIKGLPFSLPVGATVTEISATATLGGGANVRDQVILLYLSGSFVGNDQGQAGAWSGSRTWGDSGTWGVDPSLLTAAIINGGDFGFEISASAIANATAVVSEVSMTITYLANGVLFVATAWSIVPDATSTYSIGGIPATLLSGLLEFVPNKGDPERKDADDADSERSLRVVFQPTTHANTLHASLIFDHASAANPWPMSNEKNGVKYTRGDPLVALSLMAAQSRLGPEVGHKPIVFDNCAQGDVAHSRWVAFQLAIVQSLDPILLYGVIGQGVRSDV